MIDVSITRPAGQTLYAYPDLSYGFSLADWITHREPLMEGTSPNTGIYTAQLDETKALLWRVFQGASQPSNWDASFAFFPLAEQSALNTLLDRTISQAVVFTNNPVATDGSLSEIIIGDDYLNANGRAFQWTVPAVTGFTAATCVVTFGGKATINSTVYSWSATGTATDNGDDTWTLSVDLAKTATSSLVEGLYRWSVEVKNASNVEVTKVKNEYCTLVRLVEKQT